MSQYYVYTKQHGFGSQREPLAVEAWQAEPVPENPFEDPIAPTPVHLPRSPNWPPQQYFAGSSVSIRTYDSWEFSVPGSPETQPDESLERLAPSNENGVPTAELPDRSKDKSKWSTRTKERIFTHAHPQSILHLMDFRSWFWPITYKKYFVLFSIAYIIAAIVASNFYFHWIDKSLAITRSYMLPVLIISVCAEPLIIMIILPLAKIPDIPKEEIDLIMNREDIDLEVGANENRKELEGPFETALVIPCHNTDEAAIRTTLESAFPHFRPQDIFIVDNGRSKYPKHPTCNFRAYLRTIHPDIVYIWSPLGSKNAAQLIGTLAAKDYKYIMTVDDDVCIPKNFCPPIEMINDKFKAVAYPLKAMDADCNVPLWLVAWQDVEYRLSGLSKLVEDRLCGVQFPHGAGWFVEREAFLTLMQHHHPMDFIAEDCNAGLGLSRMGKGIRFDARSYLATEVPTTFFGPGLNWWKQRQKSWEMGRHGRTFAFIRQLLFSLPARKTPQGIFWHKLTYFYLICTNAIDWLRIPTVVALGRTADWWRNAILLMLFSALPPLVYKYIKCRRRPDLQPRFWACLTYPWYKLIYVIVAIFGAIRCVGYYFGGHQRPLTIQQMLRRKDERCFWLDPRFETNPAWLADEGEAQQARMSTEAALSTHNNPDDNEVNIMNISLEPPLATYQTLGSTDINFPLPPRSPPSTSPRSSSSISPSPRLSPRASATTIPALMSSSSAAVPRKSSRPWLSALGASEINTGSQSVLIETPRSHLSMMALPRQETRELLPSWGSWDQRSACSYSAIDGEDRQHDQNPNTEGRNYKAPRRKLQKHKKKESVGGSEAMYRSLPTQPWQAL